MRRRARVGRSEWPFLIKVMDGEDWPSACGWDEASTNAWLALRQSLTM